MGTTLAALLVFYVFHQRLEKRVEGLRLEEPPQRSVNGREHDEEQSGARSV